MVTILTEETKGKQARFISLRWILLAAYALTGIVPLILMASTMLHSVQGYFLEERKKELLSQANVISGQAASSNFFSDEESRKELEEVILETGQNNNFRVLVLDSACMVIYDTGYEEVGKTFLLPEVIEALENKDTARVQENGTVYAAASIVGTGNSVDGVVLISDAVTDIQAKISDIAQKAYLMVGVMVLIVFLLMVVVSQVFTEPVKSVIRVVQKMSEGHFEQRAIVRTKIHNEVVDLAIACNQMADQLEKVESSRQQFVSNVSHELKTPLAILQNYSHALKNDKLDAETRDKYLEVIESASVRMNALVTNILRLNKLENQQLKPETQAIDLKEMLINTVLNFEDMMDGKEIEPVCELDEVCIHSSFGYLELIWNNLISNAIKFSHCGGKIVVSLKKEGGLAVVTVQDFGIGMSSGTGERIFDKFYQGDASHAQEGNGLGLAIVKRIIDLLGGEISVESKPECGTKFTVKIGETI